MIMTIIVGVALVACLIVAGTWVIQISAAIIVLAFRAAVILIVFAANVLGGLMWVGWWIVSPRTAMAALRHKNLVRVDKTPPPPSPYGEKPFRRRQRTPA